MASPPTDTAVETPRPASRRPSAVSTVRPPLREMTATDPGANARSASSPPIAPSFIRSPGRIRPTELGPTTVAPCSRARATRRAASSRGTFSVATTSSPTPAASASQAASSAAAGGTDTREAAIGPPAATASSTLS